ncbi:MAG TPA: 2-hydroxyacid dehydrogenase, partial [Verrucomicrobiae bacterium]|nr:2-hydroxyacid dehydrogenase [Verrucomicrobiae bacterium]
MPVTVYDTKPYDRQYLESHREIEWHFHDFRLSAKTTAAAENTSAVCVFVNDQVDRECLERLAALGIKLVALRCAGFNNVDLNAARAANIQVVRVPAYSPYAVAEHAIGLLLTLNRKIHCAYNRAREHNFS